MKLHPKTTYYSLNNWRCLTWENVEFDVSGRRKTILLKHPHTWSLHGQTETGSSTQEGGTSTSKSTQEIWYHIMNESEVYWSIYGICPVKYSTDQAVQIVQLIILLKWIWLIKSTTKSCLVSENLTLNISLSFDQPVWFSTSIGQ